MGFPPIPERVPKSAEKCGEPHFLRKKCTKNAQKVRFSALFGTFRHSFWNRQKPHFLCRLMFLPFGLWGLTGNTQTQNLIVKFDGEICGGTLVENDSDDFPQQKKLENLLPNFAGSSPPISPKTAPTSLWKSLVLKYFQNLFRKVRITKQQGSGRKSSSVDWYYLEAWAPPQFQEKSSRSVKAILGAFGEFRGILRATLGVQKLILGRRNSILGMASHDFSNMQNHNSRSDSRKWWEPARKITRMQLFCL